VDMPNKFDGYVPIPEERVPDRPLECSECKKPIAIHYTEIVSSTMTHTSMCADCPVVQRRLYGDRFAPTEGNQQSDGRAGLACGNCETTLEAVHMGSLLGCSVCYEIFEDALISELGAMEKIPPRMLTMRKSQPLHLGRTQGETQEISAAMRLLALNEALTETLQREDYEQAAWLRDQIKALTDVKEGATPATPIDKERAKDANEHLENKGPAATKEPEDKGGNDEQ